MNNINKYSENLMSLKDKVVFYPYDGIKRTRILNRTQIKIKIGRHYTTEYAPCSVKLRTSEREQDFQLNLEEVAGVNCYTLKSLCETPFLHNGNYSFFSVMRSGDRVDLGHNRLVFKKEATDSSDELPIDHWPEDSYLCLEGETGTGKSRLAKEMHNHFVGKNSPFVAINLSAFSEGLIESELFGHDKGSFTGALKERRGAVELARGGTLFIDEVDSLPLHLQVKLLQFLDDRSFRRVGGERLLKTNCRIIFASGRPLRTLTGQGKFRSDLYFRISAGLYIKLRPLREQNEKTYAFLKKFSFENSVTFSKELIEFYMNCPWPGNYRQLSSHLKRKAILNRGQSLIRLDHEDQALLELAPDQGSEEFEFKTLEELKKEHCFRVFTASNGHYERASKRLGIAISTLRRTLAS